jgi:hypothetical protein
MQSLLLGVAVLACPVGMTLMMWMMMRGQGKETAVIDVLRTEIEQLKAQRANDRTTGGQ